MTHTAVAVNAITNSTRNSCLEAIITFSGHWSSSFFSSDISILVSTIVPHASKAAWINSRLNEFSSVLFALKYLNTFHVHHLRQMIRSFFESIESTTAFISPSRLLHILSSWHNIFLFHDRRISIIHFLLNTKFTFLLSLSWLPSKTSSKLIFFVEMDSEQHSTCSLKWFNLLNFIVQNVGPPSPSFC